MKILVIGPSESAKYANSPWLVNTTSQSPHDWTIELSPFYLGPVSLYDGRESKTMENAWQFAKVYAQHIADTGEPSSAYWQWAEEGWANPKAVRYPMGKGAKPAYSYWAGERLSYVDARLKVYWPLYRDAVARTSAFERLLTLAETAEELVLFDFDGYDFEARRMSFSDVLLNPNRSMGHAFVLKAMLEHGTRVEPEDIIGAALPGQQLGLF
ncbi:hypothetical protein F6X40_09375 [Paraburkholderia sp. UCT31]|uniref:DUF6939 family protein n=1 Tax=Paraburkholderia sp. UCT31 TaxID=2615209 RepID=UPI0016566497|nr:hypothetical protein [Paraburkholderia sp. UCT31]MBC8737018.1 hypothetical protein [Paraburkholderia sp. UCT31]